MKEFRFWSMRRSGHHAVMNWVKQNLTGSIFFKNNIANCGKNFRYMKLKPLIFKRIPDFYIYNIEERNIDEMLDEMSSLIHIYKCSTGSVADVIIVRDPFNFFASRLKAKIVKPSTVCDIGALTDESMLMYIHYAKEFLRITTFLRNPICINFNKWFISEEYRISLSGIFGFPYSNKGLNTVGFPRAVRDRTAGVSSFDGVSFNNKAQKMGVLSRWKTIGESDMEIIRNNKELMDLSNQIFDLSEYQR